jgi:hypothetical protein
MTSSFPMTSSFLAECAGNVEFPPELSALMSALHMGNANTEDLRKLPEDEWRKCLDFADLSHMTLTLSMIPDEGFPTWVIERLRRNVRDNSERYERVKSTYIEAATALEKAQVEHIVLKGFTQSPHYVSNPRLRVQSDLDFFCPREEIERAREALEGIGYRSDKSSDNRRADHLPAMVRLGSWQWAGNHYDPTMPLSIELHFVLWNEGLTLLSVPDIKLFWERRKFRMVEGLAFAGLSDGDHLAYLALHVLRNIVAGDWVIHHVHELANFLHSHSEDQEFWQCWKQTYSKRLRMLAAIAFVHAGCWFHCKMNAEVETEIEELPEEIKSWLRTFACSSLEGMFRPNRDWVWLHTALLTSARDRRRVVSSALIPRQVPKRSSPAISLNLRRTMAARSRNPQIQYFLFLGARTANHLSMVSTTLSRRVGWWFSQKQLGRQFWRFLAASFFLTWAFQFTFSYSICS